MHSPERVVGKTYPLISENLWDTLKSDAISRHFPEQPLFGTGQAPTFDECIFNYHLVRSIIIFSSFLFLNHFPG